MAEDTNIILESKEPALGKIEVAPQVLEIIVGIAASQTDGVARMRGSLANSVNELFGRKEHGKGVKLTFDGDELAVDVYVYLNYGVAVPKVALAIQDSVKQQLLFMTDLDLHEVNVHVEGVIPEKTAQQVDPDNLFNQPDEGDSEQS
ncbi:Asp23/Gls24 family envelope stress response protein [Levilactobacillus namurensis]|uniref:Asp23/Gls24 family envelope stress response protein n=1 Tax=Levilactobacillus namurensis TaxID=380393 RepID=UPI001D3431DA|nr:Asp23/Gls24 family envelope stress response protein [Levilactobacillus namurensis]HJE44744.1 Asp23/Gls24 family envelope stress response protein [Levilactobacillus namurensis]